VLATDLQESLRIRDIASEVQQKGRHRNFQTNLEGLLLQFSKRLSAEIPLLSPESARKTLRNKNESERVDSQEFYNFVLSAYSSKKSHKKSHDVIAEVLRLELAQNKLLDHYQYRLAGLVVQALSQHETVRSQLNSLSESSAKLAVVSAALAPKDTTSTNKPLQRKILSRELFVSTFALRASATLLKIRLKKLVDRDVDLDADITTSLAELVASYAGMMRGPFMKLAQMANFFGFSLPSATRERLHDLFDNSRFVSADRARSIVETELGRPIDDVFQTWIDRPIACASVAQVHKAQLRTGEWVAVKIQHPDFDAMLRSDMRMIKSILPLMRWLFPNSDASAHFQKNFESLEIESDFHHEAEMMRKFRAHFAQDADVHVPKVFDELTSRKILVMEFVEGTSFRQYAESASMEDRAQSIRTIHKFIGKTTFEMGLINPDLHPGNFIFRTDGKVSFIDLGMSAVIDVERAKLYRSLLNAALSGDDSSTKRALFQLGFADDKNAEILSKAVHAAFIQDEHGLLLANDDTIKAIQNLFGRSTYSQLKSPLPASDFLVPRALFTFMNTVRELMGSTSPGKSKSSVKALAG